MAETREKVTIEFGADGTKLETGLSGLERTAKRAGDKVQGAFKLKGERAVTAQARGFMADLGRARSGVDVIAAAGLHMSEAVRASSIVMGAGIAAGVGFGVTAIQTYTEEVKKAKSAQLELGNISFGSGADSITAAIEKTKSIREGMESGIITQGAFAKFFDRAGAGLTQLVTHPFRHQESGEEQQADEMKQANLTSLALNDLLTGKMRDQDAIQVLLMEGQEKQAALAKIRLEGEQAIAAIYERQRTSGGGMTLEQAKAQAEVQASINKSKEAAAQREISLQANSIEFEQRKLGATTTALQEELKGSKFISTEIKIQLETEEKINAIRNNQLLTSQQKFDSEKAIIAAQQAQVVMAQREEDIRLSGIRLSTQRSRDEADMTEDKLNGLEKAAALLKVYSDIDQKVNALEGSRAQIGEDAYNSQIVDLQNIKNAQLDLVNAQFAVSDARLKAETTIANLDEKTSDRRIDSIEAEEAAEITAIQFTTGAERQKHLNKLEDLKNEHADAAIARHKMTGRERADETRENHARDIQKRIDAAHGIGDVPTPKPVGKTGDKEDNGWFAQAVADALKRALTGVSILVKEA